jgi:ubiquinone/menaquinone biosynthesis C-methylase UbiE
VAALGDADDRARAVWDRFAPRYDGAMRCFDRMLVRDGRAWVGARAAGRVLEVGVGTGLNLPYYPQGVEVSAVDLSERMLEQARERAAASALEIALTQASASELPFSDDEFDTVVCVLALCCIPDDVGAVGEMRRVLRPGGTLLLLDHVPSVNAVLRAGQRLLDPITVRTAGDHQMRRPLRLVQRAGFEVVARERYRAGIIERLAAVKPG